MAISIEEKTHSSWKPPENRAKERAKIRWEDQVIENIKEIGLSEYKRKTKIGNNRRKLSEKSHVKRLKFQLNV